MADKQATPRADHPRHPATAALTIKVPTPVGGQRSGPVFQLKPLTLRAIWRTERGTATLSQT